MVVLADGRVYKRYYEEVGRHKVLTPAQERELLTRYYMCSNCSNQYPQAVRASGCPRCNTLLPPEATDRVHTCTTCGEKFETAVPPKYCPTCGVPRDTQAREQLLQANLRFVIRRAKKITQDPDHFLKLVSAGNVGLVTALDKFSLGRSTRFLTYAEWWIRKEMLDEIHASHLVHIPTHKQKQLRKAYKEGSYVCVHCGVRTLNPTDTEYLSSCSADTGHDFHAPLVDTSAVMSPAAVLKPETATVESCAEDAALATKREDTLQQIIRGLKFKRRDMYILLAYFNIPADDRKNEAKTLPQLAAMAQVTPERVRQIKETLLLALRKELRRRGISTGDALY